MNIVERYLNTICVFLRAVAGFFLVFIMSITCIDVVGNFFGHPILGVEELVSIVASITIAFVLPIAHKKKAHIGIDIMYRRMGTTFKMWDDLVVSILSGFLFFLATIECFNYAEELRNVGEVTSTLQIPKYIVLYGVSVGCFVLFLVIAVEVMSDLVRIVEKR